LKILIIILVAVLILLIIACIRVYWKFSRKKFELDCLSKPVLSTAGNLEPLIPPLPPEIEEEKPPEEEKMSAEEAKPTEEEDIPKPPE